MADAITTQGENTPEYIAYRLMEKIFQSEQRQYDQLTREEILATYIQCNHAVRGTYITRDIALQ